MSIWKYRRYIWDNSISELKNRYAGSSLGTFWNILQPLFQILTYTFVFSQLMAAKLPGMESKSAFAIYLCAGLIPWMSFSETILRGSNAFIENATYLKKLAIPEYIFVCQIATTSSMVLVISMVIFFFIVIFMGWTLSYLWILVFGVLILMQLFALGVSLLFATINVFFKDFGQILTTVVQLWMWFTPIVYLKDILPLSFANIVNYNPLYLYIDAMHQMVVFSKWPQISSWIYMLLVSLLSLLLGLLVLKKLRSEIRDVI